MITPQALTQPGWYLEHFASKNLLVFIPSVEHNCITIQDYNKDILDLTKEEEFLHTTILRATPILISVALCLYLNLKTFTQNISSSFSRAYIVSSSKAIALF